MPVSRQDLLEVLLMQDKIANKAKDIAGTIVGRRMTLPAGGLLAILFFYILKLSLVKRASN